MAAIRPTVSIGLEELETLALSALKATGLSDEHANIVKDVLLYAELRDNSQGLVKIVEGVVSPLPGAGAIEVEQKASGVVRINGNQNVGMVVATRAAEEAAKLAKTNGIGVAGTWNVSTSTGAIGCYAEKMALDGLIGIVMCGSPKVMAMAGGIDPVFGTNPIAIAAPTSAEPIVLDMATSAITFFEIVNAARQGTEIPDNAAFDPDGKPTNDPQEALAGAMRPFDGYKAAGLALMLEIMTAPLTGAGVVGDEDQAGNRGTLFIAIDPDPMIGRAAYLAAVDRMAERIRAGRPEISGQAITLPGERGRARVAAKQQAGTIELDQGLVEELRALGAKT
ncbi:MAG: Ldh family oxidoreductase [Alphaproteobacteria bacterium]|nr:Ldh family oxidoreductase [Alphaproteobacteria bacterium]